MQFLAKSLAAAATVTVPGPGSIKEEKNKNNQSSMNISRILPVCTALLFASFLLSYFSLIFGSDIKGLDSFWILTPFLVGALLRTPYKYWVVISLLAISGSLLNIPFFASSLKPIIVLQALIQIPVAMITALLVDLVFDNSKRELRIPHMAVACILGVIVGPGVGTVLATSFGAAHLPSGEAWFVSSMLSMASLLPLMLVINKSHIEPLKDNHTLFSFLGFLVVSLGVTTLASKYLQAPQLFIMLPLLASASLLSLPLSLLTISITLVFAIAINSTDVITWMNGNTSFNGVLQYIPHSIMALAAALLAAMFNGMRLERARLIASESRFRDAVRFSPIGIALITPKGDFTLINESLCKLIGFDGKEMAIRKINELIAAPYREQMSQDFKKLLSGDNSIIYRQVKMNHKVGEQFIVGIAASTLKDGQGKPIGLVIQFEDIQKMVSAQEALKTSEERFEFAVTSTDMGIWDLNIETQTMFISAMVRNLIGTTDQYVKVNDEFSGLPIYHEDKADFVYEVQRHIEERTPHFNIEHRIIDANGQIQWIQNRGKVISRDEFGASQRMIGTVSNITQKKNSDIAMVSLTQRLIVANKASAIGVMEWNSIESSIIYDERMLEIIGYQQSNVDKSIQFFMSLLNAEDAKKLMDALHNSIIFGHKEIDMEIRFGSKTDNKRFARIVGHVNFMESNGSYTVIFAFWDTTEKTRMQAELNEERERLQVSLNSIANAVIATDIEGKITLLNPGAVTMLGCQQQQAKGRSINDLVLLQDQNGKFLNENPISECLTLKENAQLMAPKGDIILINKNGEQFNVELTVSPMINDIGFAGVLIVAEDVTDAREMQKKLKHAASHDALTGLFNRSHFEQQLEFALQECSNSNRSHVLCLLDLDRFKIVNDSAGHTIGDALLKNISKFISQYVSPGDLLARVGGDEFGILIANCTMSHAYEQCSKIIESISSTRFSYDGNVYDIGASAGLVIINEHSKSIADLMSHADVACYSSKVAGRNRASVYEADQADVQNRHKEILVAAGLRDSIESDRLVLYAQKIVPIHDGTNLEQTRGRGETYELLVRMIDKDGVIIPPGAFIPAAERYELMGLVDRWVIKASLIRHGKRIALIPDMQVNINLSGNSLSDPTFPEFLMQVLSDTDIPKHNITFEVTETSLMNHIENAASILAKLREMGCKVALDDFGSGLSSYTYLKNFRVDNIKIDGAFIKNLHQSKDDWTIVDSMNQVAHRLGAKTTAEFVENEAILAECQVVGIDNAQGYGVHKPTSLDELLDHLELKYQVNTI